MDASPDDFSLPGEGRGDRQSTLSSKDVLLPFVLANLVLLFEVILGDADFKFRTLSSSLICLLCSDALIPSCSDDEDDNIFR